MRSDATGRPDLAGECAPAAARPWRQRLLFDEAPAWPLALTRSALLPLSLAFEVAVRCRGALHDAGLVAATRLPVRVISVGNVTVGGTGKTPLAAWLAERLLGAGARPAILLRGFGARLGAAPRRVALEGASSGDGERRESDEALLLAARLPAVPVIAGRDRVAAGRLAIEAGADVLLLDDGFQHRSLVRDLDILLLDPRVRPPRGRLLPAGPLREPWSAAARADLLVVVDGPSLAGPRGRPVARAERRAVALRDALGARSEPPDALLGRRVLLLSGIGRPAAFRSLVERLGATVVAEALFDDHHRFTPGELNAVSARAQASRAERIVTTEKDALRLPRAFASRGDVFVLAIGLAFVEGEREILAAVEGLLHATP
jgi:tetraacyldisaccharide 4'-kinase